MEKVCELLEWLSEKVHFDGIGGIWGSRAQFLDNPIEFPMDVFFSNSTSIKEFGSNFFYTLGFCINVHLNKEFCNF